MFYAWLCASKSWLNHLPDCGPKHFPASYKAPSLFFLVSSSLRRLDWFLLWFG
jgi:hypothetical protein